MPVLKNSDGAAGNVKTRCAAQSDMVVKSERGRRRYVFFRVPEGTRRDDLTAMVGGRVPSMKVITCQDGEAVVRCLPSERDALVEALTRGEGFESVRTSGTLKTLRDGYPSLRVPQRRRKRVGNTDGQT